MLRSVLIETLQVLDDMARTCEQWALESARGGWSTHQVDANLQAAHKLRAQAGALRDAINMLDNAAALSVNVSWE